MKCQIGEPSDKINYIYEFLKQQFLQMIEKAIEKWQLKKYGSSSLKKKFCKQTIKLSRCQVSLTFVEAIISSELPVEQRLLKRMVIWIEIL